MGFLVTLAYQKVVACVCVSLASSHCCRLMRIPNFLMFFFFHQCFRLGLEVGEEEEVPYGAVRDHDYINIYVVSIERTNNRKTSESMEIVLTRGRA